MQMEFSKDKLTVLDIKIRLRYVYTLKQLSTISLIHFSPVLLFIKKPIFQIKWQCSTGLKWVNNSLSSNLWGLKVMFWDHWMIYLSIKAIFLTLASSRFSQYCWNTVTYLSIPSFCMQQYDVSYKKLK